VGSIPIARSTFRCLACPCVVLGRYLPYRAVPTVSTRLQFIWSNASIGLLVEFVLDGLIGPSSGRLRKFEMAPAAVGQEGTGRDTKDPTSLPDPAQGAFQQLQGSVRDMRIGIDRDYALKGIDPRQAAAIELALRVLRDRGAQIVPVKMPDVSHVVDIWSPICAHEMSKAHAATFRARSGEYGPYLREFLVNGRQVTADQLETAHWARKALTKDLDALLDSVDAMAGPAGGDPAWPITHAIQVGPLPAYHAAWSAAAPRSSEFTMPMDLAGIPAICLPCGFSPDGLPYSIQFTGRRLGEGALFRIAYAYETATEWHIRHPIVHPT
jgi:amidase